MDSILFCVPLRNKNGLFDGLDVKSSIAMNVNGLILGEGKGIDTTTISVSSVEVFAIASPSSADWESFF